MKAIIPAAGYATRMYPLTENTSKPLLEVGGKPMLEHIIEKIEEIPEIDEIIIVTNSKFFSQFDEWNKKFESEVPVRIIDDKTNSNENKLGAIGDIALAISSAEVNDDVIIINADNLFTFDLLEAYDFFVSKKCDLVCMYDVQDIEEAKKMGVVELDKAGKIVGFVEKPTEPKSTLISTGIYFYSKQTVGLFKKYLASGYSPDKPGEFVEWLFKEKSVYGFVFSREKDKWFDIGSISVFEQVKKDFPGLKKIMEKRRKKK